MFYNLRKKYKQDYENFLSEFNYGYSIINEKNFFELDTKGYSIIDTDEEYWKKNNIEFNYLVNKSEELCIKEGTEGGWENGKVKGQNFEPSAQRISNISNKDEVFIKVSKIPDLLKAAHHVIKKPFKISSLQIRNPLPFGKEQNLHIDWRPRLFNYYNYNQFTGFVYLDDADENNGTINLFPGTHKLINQPNKEYLKKNKLLPTKIKIKKGNVLLLNVFTWHFGGKNLNGKKRRTIFINFRERSEWQQLNQKKFLDNITRSKMSKFEKYLYAVRQEDKNQNQWVFKNRNKFYIKLCHKFRDIFYHAFLI